MQVPDDGEGDETVIRVELVRTLELPAALTTEGASEVALLEEVTMDEDGIVEAALEEDAKGEAALEEDAKREAVLEEDAKGEAALEEDALTMEAAFDEDGAMAPLQPKAMLLSCHEYVVDEKPDHTKLWTALRLAPVNRESGTVMVCKDPVNPDKAMYLDV